MSNDALKWAFTVPITAPEKPVLIALADRANAANTCWPALSDVAFRSGVSESTARRAIQKLEKGGWIVVNRTQGRTSNRYILNAQPCHSDRVEPCQPDRVDDSEPSHSDRVTLSACKGNPVRLTPQPCQVDTQTLKNPQLTQRESEAPPPRIPQAGFPEKQTVLDYCKSKGWPIESGLKFWLHFDEQRSNGDRAIGSRWHWWSRLETWVMRDAAGGGKTGTRPSGNGGEDWKIRDEMKFLNAEIQKLSELHRPDGWGAMPAEPARQIKVLSDRRDLLRAQLTAKKATTK